MLIGVLKAVQCTSISHQQCLIAEWFGLNVTVRVRGASLIAGLEYGTEQWNGKWNGTVNIHSCS